MFTKHTYFSSVLYIKTMYIVYTNLYAKQKESGDEQWLSIYTETPNSLKIQHNLIARKGEK